MGKIHDAVRAKSAVEVKKLLKNETLTNEIDDDDNRQTPLHLACGENYANLDIAKLLLKKRADVNLQERNGWTPLHCATNSGQLAICQALLTTEGIDVGILTKDGTSALHYLVRSGITAGADQLLCKDILDLYKEKCGDLNAQTKNGETALHQATMRGKVLATRFLIENNAFIDSLNKFGETPLFYAVQGGNLSVVKLLLDNGADVNVKGKGKKVIDYSPTQEIFDVVQEYSRISMEKKRIEDEKIKTEQKEKFTQRDKPKASHGWIRGECIISDCTCIGYLAESPNGGACQSCEHWPAQHKNFEDTLQPNAPPTSDWELDDSKTDNSDLSAFTKVKSRFASTRKTTKDWEINPADLTFTKAIGVGPIGKTFCVLFEDNNIAVKVIDARVYGKALEEYKKEFVIFSTLDSPYIVPFVGACTKPVLAIATDFCPKGSLFDFLNDTEQMMDWNFIFQSAKEILQGLHYLHNHRPTIIHRNLRSSNIMLGSDGKMKLIDFGKARMTGEDGSIVSSLGSLRGAYAYCAPETFFGKIFTENSDVYSFGIVLWEMVHRLLTKSYLRPHSGSPDILYHFQVIVQSAKQNLRPLIHPSCPASLSELMQQCWTKNMQRPTIGEILQQLDTIAVEYASSTSVWDSKCK